MTFLPTTARGVTQLREDLDLLNNGGFASIRNNQTVEERLLIGRVFDDTGTETTVRVPKLSTLQFDFPAQPSDALEFTLAPGVQIARIFTQVVDAFNKSHKLRGVFGKCTWILDTVKDPADNSLPDAAILALPRDRLLRIVDGLQTLKTPWDFDNPDDGLGTSQAEYFADVDFPIGRKIILRWFSADGNPVRFKGDLVGGDFFPFVLTDFQFRTEEILTFKDDTVTNVDHHWSSQKIKREIDLKTALVTTTPFTVTDEDLLLVDPGVPVATITVNLPPSADRYDAVSDTAKPIHIKNIHDNNGQIVIVVPDGSEEIDEAASVNIFKKGSLTLAPDGADWWII